METNNLSLLKKEPLKIVRHHNLEGVWTEIVEYYNTSLNKIDWDNFKRIRHKILKVESEIVVCNAALKLISYGDERGLIALESIGVKAKTIKGIRAAISRKKTSLQTMKDKEGKNTKSGNKRPEFDEIKAIIQIHLPYYLDARIISVSEWVNTIKQIELKNKADADLIKKSKKR